MIQEINDLCKHASREVKVYLCHKVDSLLVLLQLERRYRFAPEDKARIEDDPQKYLEKRISELNSID